MANAILDSFYLYNFDEPHRRNFHKFLDYIKKNWFRPTSAHFVGKFSNFHGDIMAEITPQLTNSCSQSLNASLKKFYTSGYLPKYKLAEGNFYFWFSKTKSKFSISRSQKFLREKTIAFGHFSGEEKISKSMPKRFGEFPKIKSSLTAPCGTDEYPCNERKPAI